MNQFENTEKNNNSSHHKNGYVLAITGTIVDVQFPHESTPNILNELQIFFPHHNSQSAEKSEHRSCSATWVMVLCVALQ